jgi:hypothetical protein
VVGGGANGMILWCQWYDLIGVSRSPKARIRFLNQRASTWSSFLSCDAGVVGLCLSSVG